jgi:hypothetical protein
MATATAMWHSHKNPLHKVTRTSEDVHIPKGIKTRRLHKAFLRYHDANNWPMLREALKQMGRADLIGAGKHQLIPAWQPQGTGNVAEGMRRPHKLRNGKVAGATAAKTTPMRTQHTGLKGTTIPKPKPAREKRR